MKKRFLFTDDQRYDTIHAMGNPSIKTRHDPRQSPKEFSSLDEIIDNGDAKHRGHLYFAFMNWQTAIRNDRYKLIEYCVEGKRYTQLFDLIEDPQELINLAADAKYSDTLAELRALLRKERVRLNDGDTPCPFTNKQGEDFWTTYEAVQESETP